MIYRRLSLIIFLLLIGLGVFGFGDVAQSAQFGKGWYKNTIISDTTCQEGEWEARVNVFNTESETITADTIQVNATLWQDTTGDGVRESSTQIYNNTFYNLETVEACISTEGSEDDIMALTITAAKESHKTIWSYQRGRYSGSYLDGHRWTRETYLAQNEEPISLAHRFPTGNYIITDPAQYSFEVDVGLRPEAESVSDIVLRIENETTEEIFQESLTNVIIDQGTVAFPMEEYSDGRYIWHVRLMEDNEGYIYPNLPYDQFIIDTIPPTVYYPRTSPSSPSAVEDTTLIGRAQDKGSGLRKIELYLEGDLVKACFYSGSIYEESCSKNVGVLEEGSYEFKVVAEDMGGLQGERTRTFVIGTGGEAKLTVMIGRLYTDQEEYKGMEVTVRHTGGYKAGNEYQTTYSIVSDNSFETQIEWPYRMGENGPHMFVLQSTSGITSGYSCAGHETCRVTLNIEKGQSVTLMFNYSDQLTIAAQVYVPPYAYNISVPVKKIEGEIDDFQEGTTHIRMTVHNPIDAVLEFPEKYTDPTYGDIIFSHWAHCDEVFGPGDRHCGVVEDPYTHRIVRSFYDPAPTKLEVFSFVDGAEKEGADITRVSGTERTGGTTRYLFETESYLDEIETTLIAPKIHGDKSFSTWTGCDFHSITERTCTIKVEAMGYRKIATNYGEGSVNPSEEHELTVSKAGDGQGLVLSDPPGIDCGGDCSETFYLGTEVTLKAQADDNYEFTGWSGCDEEEAGNCIVQMTSDRTVTATFDYFTHTLGVEIEGGGRVMNEGIDCPEQCENEYPLNTEVTLKAQADDNYEFTGWAGCDEEEAGNCIVQMTSDKEVTATFSKQGPEVKNLKYELPEDYCGDNSASVQLFWEYEGHGKEYQGSQIRMIGPDDSEEITDVVVLPDKDDLYDLNGLRFNTEYEWQIRVQNEDGAWSHEEDEDWEKGEPFTTLPEYPNPKFTWSPYNPFAEEKVSFTDSGHNIIKRWEWTFKDDGTPGESNEQNPEIFFETEGEKNVLLRVWNNGLYCDMDKDVEVRPPLPDDWREVDPS